jgi:hypothetical protein
VTGEGVAMSEYKKEMQTCMTEMSKRMPVGSRMLYASLMDYLRKKVRHYLQQKLSPGILGNCRVKVVGCDATQECDSIRESRPFRVAYRHVICPFYVNILHPFGLFVGLTT